MIKTKEQIIPSQKKTIDEIERLNLLLEQTGVAAHDLNQPLMALLGYVELLEMNRNNVEKTGPFIEKIKLAGYRISDIVRTIQNSVNKRTRQVDALTDIIEDAQETGMLSAVDPDKGLKQ